MRSLTLLQLGRHLPFIIGTRLTIKHLHFIDVMCSARFKQHLVRRWHVRPLEATGQYEDGGNGRYLLHQGIMLFRSYR